MGTRSTCGIRIDQTDKISYNHFDGYFEGVGENLLDELKERFAERDYEDALGELKQKARTARVVDDDATPTEADIRKMLAEGAVDLTVSNQTTEDWYCLTRKHHGSILKRLDCGIFTDGTGLLDKGDWVEYGYILNLDDENFEVYCSNVKKPATNKSRYDAPLIAVYPLAYFLAMPDLSELAGKLGTFKSRFTA